MSYKIVIIGDSGVGKSSLLQTFLGNEFNIGQQITIGVDYGKKQIKLENEDVKLQIWDTAGQEVFRSISKSYYRGSHGAFVVFDLSKKHTLDNVEYWIKELFEHNPDIPIIIVGNKNDMTKRINDLEIENIITKFNFISYIETSAKNKFNIDTMFTNLAFKIHNKCKENLTLTNTIKPKYYYRNNCC